MLLLRHFRRALWTLSGHFGRPVSTETGDRLTILVAFHHPSRMRHADAIARNLLRCTFVDRVIFSNHNPTVTLASYVRVSDPRLSVLEAGVRRGCAFRWHVALQWKPTYLVVVDDDILLYPKQLRTLFLALRAEPGRLHGIFGLRRTPDGGLSGIGGVDREVECLCEVYALTRTHLERYEVIRQRLSGDLRRAADEAIDFPVISRTGIDRPRIHRVGRVLRAETFKTPGVAVHLQPTFWQDALEVVVALDAWSAGGSIVPGIGEVP